MDYNFLLSKLVKLKSLDYKGLELTMNERGLMIECTRDVIRTDGHVDVENHSISMEMDMDSARECIDYIYKLERLLQELNY